MFKRIFGCLLAVLLVGCAATGPKLSEIRATIPPVPEGQGRVFFYRNSSVMGAAVTSDIKLNDELVGRSVRSSFFYIDHQPGSYTVRTATEWEHKYDISIEPGKTLYMRSWVIPGVLVGHIVVEKVDEAKAMTTIEQENLAYIGALPTATKTAATSVPVTPAPAQPVEQPALQVAPLKTADYSAVYADADAKAKAEAQSILDLKPEGEPQAALIDVAMPSVAVQNNPTHVLGSWSYEVEQKAKDAGCEGDGAWRTQKADLSETYQVDCHTGGHYLSVCDSGGCRPAKAN